MGFSDQLSAADVILDASVKNKEGLLEMLAAEAAGRLGCPEKKILDALTTREDLGSTALGKGVALPHAQLAAIEQPIVLFVRLERPIDFDARDGEPIDLVFMVLWPAATPKGLLAAMGEISRTLREASFLRRVRIAETPEEVVALLSAAEDTNEDQDAVPRET